MSRVQLLVAVLVITYCCVSVSATEDTPKHEEPAEPAPTELTGRSVHYKHVVPSRRYVVPTRVGHYHEAPYFGRVYYDDPIVLSRWRRATGTFSEEAEKVIKSANELNTSDVGSVSEFLEKQKMNICMARIICELSNNGKAHGESGAKLGKYMMEKFRSAKHEKAKFYMDAMQAGAKAKSMSACGRSFECTASLTEIIDVTNKILHI